ncbi:hypothetical protein BZM27_19465 [Paraburkholderia steynii]|uniref:Uncharacterized protein n=1 Tax=Paraburkholderia steynii TaxID=1245441 RepID=A0A4V2NH45_9BURK|nr:hypothetical protein BZM27_19465 [Paraburkholderia steynii]
MRRSPDLAVVALSAEDELGTEPKRRGDNEGAGQLDRELLVRQAFDAKEPRSTTLVLHCAIRKQICAAKSPNETSVHAQTSFPAGLVA